MTADNNDDVIDTIDEHVRQAGGIVRSRPSVPHALARIAFRRALGRDLTRRLASFEGPGIAIIVQAPGVDWVEPIRLEVRRFAERCETIARNGSARTTDKPDVGNDDVATALAAGQHCVGISHAPSRFLPSSLVTVADARIEVRAPGPAQIGLLLRICVGRSPRAIPENAGAGLGFHEIVSAFRQGASPEQVLAYLAAASSARTRVTATDDTPTLQNLAGYGEARTWGLELAEGVAAWRRNELPWGSLSAAAVLFGPPGTGKTMFARSLARTLEVPIVCTSLSSLFATTSGYLDAILRQIQADWDTVRGAPPGIFFVDELDAIPNRATVSDRHKEYWTTLSNAFLVMLDGAAGAASKEGVVVLGATNFPDRLDAALVRPGRFDRLIEIKLPGPAGLAAILRHHLGDALPGADLEFVARLRPDGTGAMAAQWARDARAAARAAGRPMEIDDLVACVAPPDRRAPEDLWRTCVHEAGHAVMYVVVARALDSVTTVRDGTHGGATVGAVGSPTPTAVQLEDTVRILLGGRAAEVALLGSPSTGAQSDLARATAIVGGMHAAQGLGESLLYRTAPEDILPQLTYDAALRRTVEAHVARLYAETLSVLRQKAGAVERLARELQRRRALTGAEARAIVAGRTGVSNQRRGL